MLSASSLLITAALGISSVAAAGNIIISEVPSEAGTKQQKIYLEKDMIRVDTQNDSKEMSFIYRADKSTLWVINNTEKSYMELTKDEVDRTVAQLTTMKSMLEKNMAFLSEDQRKALAKNVPSLDSGKSIESRITKNGVKCGKFTCDIYEITEEGTPKHEVHVTKTSKIGLGKDEIKTLEDFGEFAQPVIRLFNFEQSAWFLKSEKDKVSITEVPVLVHSLKNGKKKQVHKLTEVKTAKNDPGLFELPEGYKKGGLNLFR